MYYLQSRYYDADVGRFVNADGQINTDALLGYNMFAYCHNNPIILQDSTGNRPIISMDVKSETVKEKEFSFSYMNTMAKYRLTSDEMVVVATIAAEATVAANNEPVSSEGRQAMANVIMNRIGSCEWSEYTTASDICKSTGFDGYGDTNYYACLQYLYTRDGKNQTYEAIIADVIPVYRGEVVDITEGCQLYYTPATMTPPGSIPGWNFSVLSEVVIDGVDPYYEGRFFRYK